MTFISIAAAIILAIMGIGFGWKLRSISKEVKGELRIIKEIKQKAGIVAKKAQGMTVEIERLKTEIEMIKKQAESNLVDLKSQSVIATELIRKELKNRRQKSGRIYETTKMGRSRGYSCTGSVL